MIALIPNCAFLSETSRMLIIGQALRQRGIWTPVILMSGHTNGEDQTGLRDMGVHAWLDKPIGSWQLAKVLTNALAHAPAQRN